MKESLYLHKKKWMLGTMGAVVLVIFLWPKMFPSSEMTEPPVFQKLVVEERDQEEVEEPNQSLEQETNDSPRLPATVLIDIKGAVRLPGVYELLSGERIIDAVDKAGGFLPNADTRKVNLASLLVDEMVIYVPEEGEETEELTFVETPNDAGGKGAVDKKVNINTATEEELTTLSGIGPSKAQAIIEYREENGLFKSVDDMLNVTGIGEKSLEKIRDEITTTN
ncbi:competence protein ComEA [Bacillus tianshenii]|uniref:Competence protein ComEA n=1 Tax=Sutcliffiella tianshenii TaxID=1463404 RepID=A0ABS2P044_9BACI|nr:competence protein ComEA [Bacillus tianshenii]